MLVGRWVGGWTRERRVPTYLRRRREKWVGRLPSSRVWGAMMEATVAVEEE